MDPRAVNRMLTVMQWFQFMRARTPARHKRDVAVTLGLAQGLSMRQISALMQGKGGHSAAHMVKQKALGQISQGLRALLWKNQNEELTKSANNCINLKT